MKGNVICWISIAALGGTGFIASISLIALVIIDVNLIFVDFFKTISYVYLYSSIAAMAMLVLSVLAGICAHYVNKKDKINEKRAARLEELKAAGMYPWIAESNRPDFQPRKEFSLGMELKPMKFVKVPLACISELDEFETSLFD